MSEVTHILRHIHPERVKALSDNFYSEGWYTQAKEIDDLGHERDMLLRASEQLQKDVEAQLSAERTRRESAERITDLLIEICDHSPPLLLMHRISALAGEAKAYRTQYPRVEEEKK